MNEERLNPVDVTEYTVGGDHIDQYGHVNYKDLPAIFEAGQDRYLEARGMSFDGVETEFGLRSFVKKTQTVYNDQLREGELVRIFTSISRLGNTSLTCSQWIEKAGVNVADYEMVVVFVNQQDQPTPLPQLLRERLLLPILGKNAP